MGGMRARILVVDDDDDVRATTVTLLSLGRHVAVPAASAQEALARVLADPFDLLLTDIVLGTGLNGFELAKRAVLLRPQLQVIYATGYAFHLAEQHARVPGSVMLQKPYLASDLKHALALVLGPGPGKPARKPPRRPRKI